MTLDARRLFWTRKSVQKIIDAVMRRGTDGVFIRVLMRSIGAVAAFLVCAGTSAAQPSGIFTRTGDMTSPRAQHSATLLADGRVLVAGGTSSNSSVLATTELYDPATGTFRAAASMIAARRMHTATLLPDDRVLFVGGYTDRGALSSAELYDPVTGTFSATGNLANGRGGHTAILLPTGKVLVIGGYGTNAFPNVAPAELYDPVAGTFSPAGAYIGRGGCDFCAPSVLLADGTVLFPGQYPVQRYDPATDTFSPSGMMIYDQSGASLLANGQVLFAGGEGFGRYAYAELYNPANGTFIGTGSMGSPRVWHTLTPLPDGKVLATGGETDACAGNGCWFAGTVTTAELYDPSAGSFVPTGSMAAARESHTATVLLDGKVLLIGGVSYGGIGIYFGSMVSAELYVPDHLIPAPALGAVFHAGTTHVVNSDDPAVAGESVDIYCTGLLAGSVNPPQVAIGGRLADIIAVSNAPGLAGVNLVRVRVPSRVAGGAVPVRLTYGERLSNELTLPTR